MEKQLNNMQRFIFAGKPVLIAKEYLELFRMFLVSLPYIMLVFLWYKAFSGGRESIRDEQRNGKPTMTRTCKNIARVVDILKEDCRFSCRLVGEWTRILKTTV